MMSANGSGRPSPRGPLSSCLDGGGSSDPRVQEGLAPTSAGVLRSATTGSLRSRADGVAAGWAGRRGIRKRLLTVLANPGGHRPGEC